MANPAWELAKEFELTVPEKDVEGPTLRWKVGGTLKARYRVQVGDSPDKLSLGSSGTKLAGGVSGKIGDRVSLEGSGTLDAAELKSEIGGDLAIKIQDELAVKLSAKVDPAKLKKARSPKEFGTLLGEQISLAVSDEWNGLSGLVGGKAKLSYEAGVQASTHPLVVKVTLEFVPFSRSVGTNLVELSVTFECKLSVGPGPQVIQAGGWLMATIVIDGAFLAGVAHIVNRAHDVADAKGCLLWYTEGCVRKMFELPDALPPRDARHDLKMRLYKHGQREAYAYAQMACLGGDLSNKHPVHAYRDWLISENGGRKDHAINALRNVMNAQLDEIGTRLGVRV